MEKFVEIFGMGWSIFTLVLLAFIAIGSVLINVHKDTGSQDKARK